MHACTTFSHCITLIEIVMLVQVIIVMDPAAAGKPRLPIIHHSSDTKLPPREKRYVFDKAYDGNTDNRTLYNGTVKASLLWASKLIISCVLNAYKESPCDRHIHWSELSIVL